MERRLTLSDFCGVNPLQQHEISCIEITSVFPSFSPWVMLMLGMSNLLHGLVCITVEHCI